MPYIVLRSHLHIKNWYAINKEKGSEEGILTALEDYAAIKFPTLGFQIKLKATDFAPKSVAFGPSGEIRTPGVLNPNQVPYQLGHTRILNFSSWPFRNFRSNCGQISGHRTNGGSIIQQGKREIA